MCRIQHYVVGLKMEERRMKGEVGKSKNPFGEAAERKISIPKQLNYPMVKTKTAAMEKEDDDKGQESRRTGGPVTIEVNGESENLEKTRQLLWSQK